MTTTARGYRLRRFFFSGSLCKEYLVTGCLALLVSVAVYRFKTDVRGGEFVWQAFLGIFTGLFVGYMVDAVEAWNKTRFLAVALACIHVEERLQVITATLPDRVAGGYKNTGPGETIAIGLLYSAYSNLFSSGSRTFNGSNISVRPSVDVNDLGSDEEQKIILGGPRYNHLTRKLLERHEIGVHYSIDDKSQYQHRLMLKDGTTGWRWKQDAPIDFGLVIKLGRVLHVSGCRTWGVIGAATCLFSESSAARLISKIWDEGIDPLSADYFAVISCAVPNFNDEFSIGAVKVLHVEVITS